MVSASSYDRFGPFLIVRALGRGGMGEVYVARTRFAHAKLAAVKRLRPDVARVPTFAERFKHEADLAVRLSHPNVVATIDVGSVHNQLYVASELILGKDAGHIADRLRERGLGAPVAVVIRLLLDTLTGLAYVHGVREPTGRWLGLVHRDITPGNVLVGYDGVSRIADFGLAKSVLVEGGRLTGHGEILGTPHYLAPEIIRGEEASPSSDLYGLGAVTYRILTGIAPFQGTTAEVLFRALNEEPRPIRELRPDLPDWFAVLVHEMLQKEPRARPHDAGLLVERLRHEAERSKLLLQPPSVGRWLTQLFEAERDEEMAEKEALELMDPSEVPEVVEGTVVLARVRPGTQLLPPPAVRVEADSDGTELDQGLDDTALRQGYEAEEESLENMRTWAVALDEKILDTPRVRDFDDEEGTEFAAQRVAQQGSSPRTKIVSPDLDVDTGDDDAFDSSELDTRLPGFADTLNPSEATDNPFDGASDVAEEEQATRLAEIAPGGRVIPKVDTGRIEPKRRPRGVDSVVVEPARPAVRTGDLPTPRVESPPAPRPAPASRPSVQPSPPSREVVITPARGGRDRLVYFVVALALLVSGLAMGLWIRDREASVVVAQPDGTQAALRSRYMAVRAEVVRRKEAGTPVPPETTSLLADAATALLDGDEASARTLVEALERAVATPSP